MGWTKDGKWVDEKVKPDSSKNNNNQNNNNQSTGKGGGGGSTSDNDGKMSSDEKAALKSALLWAYKQCYEGKAPPMPKGLLTAAMKYRFSDPTSVLDWLRKNARGRYQKTTFAKSRANEANSLLDSIFGEGFKAKAGFIEKYVMGDAEVWSMEKYLEKVVVKSKAFLNLMGGADVWRGFYNKVKGTYEEAIQKLVKLKADYLDTYKELMGNALDVTEVPKVFWQQAIKNNWSVDQFSNYIRNNDQRYLLGTPAKDRGDLFDRYWKTMFGDTVAVNEKLKEGFMKQDDEFGQYFDKYIRTSDTFKQNHPDYEEWASKSTGTPGSGAPIDPMDYFKDLAEFRNLYQELAETPGKWDEDWVRNAVKNGWSPALARINFRQGGNGFSNTAEYKTRGEKFDAYWRQMFGTNSTPDQAVRDRWVRGLSDDVETSFNEIKNTQEFQRQYGDWDVFSSAQSAAGMGQSIINNPAQYRQYQDMLQASFARIGVQMPAELQRGIFAANIDEQDLNQNLQTWVRSNVAYKTVTGQEAKIEEASGAQGRVLAGDLSQRMQKALEQYKTFASSKENTFDAQQKRSGLVTQSI